MALRIYNTLSRQKEEFQPINPQKVGMYVCGITPYDETHLGHARAYVAFDTIRRYLEYSGYAVTYVQNITDVDDKIIAKGQGARVKCQEIADKYTSSYFEVMDKLNVRRANVYPKATEHIPEMIQWISGLIEKGYAYVLDDGVYFEVNKFQDYGKLSGRIKEDQEAGARVKIDAHKRSPLDFSLWKKAKEGEPAWESPWGAGRPGWHIECSVMSTKYLGEQFDIHGGGMDLEFPHHENEIAQTEALTGKAPWVKYWVHNGFVNINKQKMSKSLGNFFTLKDIFKKYDPMAIRFFLLSTHYRSPINYSDPEIDSVREGYRRICQFIADIDFIKGKTHPLSPSLNKRGGIKGGELEEVEREDLDEELGSYREKFREAMEDDFNTAGAIASIFEMIKFCRKTLDEGEVEKECLEVMRKSVVDMCGVLGLEIVAGCESRVASRDIEKLITEREMARREKDFKRADDIRRQLAEQGIIIEDTPLGTKWKAQT